MLSSRPIWAEVSLNAISHNLRAIQKKVGRYVKILAAVKCDAYGHGGLVVSKRCVTEGVAMLGVASAEEAMSLRDGGVRCSILIMGTILPVGLRHIVVNDIRTTVSESPFAEELSRVARGLKKKAAIHIEVDTGMGRGGLNVADAQCFIESVNKMRDLTIEGIYTHFPSSDERDKTFSLKQIDLFSNLLSNLEKKGMCPPLRHASNSGAILSLPSSYFNMVRPGISIYGLYPSPSAERSLNLTPSLGLKARITFLKDVPPQTPISYGRTYVTKRPSVIAVVPCGYGDGFPRALSNKGEVLIRGRRVSIVGRVCMDQMMIDVTDIPKVSLGEEVVIYGKQGKGAISVEEVAEKLSSIPYELVCAISKRVVRCYV